MFLLLFFPTEKRFIRDCITESTSDNITNIIAAQLEDMHKQGILTSPTHLQITTTVDSFTNTHDTTFLDDEPIASGTYLTSTHLEGTPYIHVITLPTCSPATTVSYFLRANIYGGPLPCPIQASPHGSQTVYGSPSSIRPRRPPTRMWTACSQPKTHAQSAAPTSKALPQSWPSHSFGRRPYSHYTDTSQRQNTSNRTAWP